MTEQKFKCYSKIYGLSSQGSTLKHLMCCGEDLLLRYDTFIQFLGYCDSTGVEVYEGDVLELKITDDLMDKDKNMFYNSNLGKRIAELGDVTSVLLVHSIDKKFMTMDYKVYFCRDGKIDRDDFGDIVWEGLGYDHLFPLYFAEKGGKVIGNLLLDSEILN